MSEEVVNWQQVTWRQDEYGWQSDFIERTAFRRLNSVDRASGGQAKSAGLVSHQLRGGSLVDNSNKTTTATDRRQTTPFFAGSLVAQPRCSKSIVRSLCKYSVVACESSLNNKQVIAAKGRSGSIMAQSSGDSCSRRHQKIQAKDERQDVGHYVSRVAAGSCSSCSADGGTSGSGSSDSRDRDKAAIAGAANESQAVRERLTGTASDGLLSGSLSFAASILFSLGKWLLIWVSSRQAALAGLLLGWRRHSWRLSLVTNGR